ncbi:MAG TPA: hypothetical protein VFE20_00710 [Thermoleophilia bacterium]|nr:hypothetical protein [Thermoleophilia bacterium]
MGKQESRLEKLQKMDEDQLLQELAKHEDDYDDLVQAELQRRQLKQSAGINSALCALVIINAFSLVLAAVAVWYWFRPEVNWGEVKERGLETAKERGGPYLIVARERTSPMLEVAKRGLEEGTGEVKEAWREARESAGGQLKKSKKKSGWLPF